MLSAWRLPSVQSSGSRVCRSPYLRHGGLGRCSRRTPEQRLGTGSTRAQLLLGLWDLPGPGVEPVSPALAGGFFTPWATREAQQGCFFFFFLFFFAEWTTHARKGLPALLTLQALSEFPECLCEPCTQYSATSQTWTSQWAGSWQEGWGTVLEGHLVQTHNPAFRNHRWLLKA